MVNAWMTRTSAGKLFYFGLNFQTPTNTIYWYSTIQHSHRHLPKPSLLTMAKDPPTTKATVLISGEGSNLQALIDATGNLMPYLKIVRVISNKLKANGLNRAEAASIPTTYHNLVSKERYYKKGEKDESVKQAARKKYDTDLAELILKDEPDIVICAGRNPPHFLLSIC